MVHNKNIFLKSSILYGKLIKIDYQEGIVMTIILAHTNKCTALNALLKDFMRSPQESIGLQVLLLSL